VPPPPSLQRLALSGSETQKVDYQVHCGPALGAFNQWVKDTPLRDWRNRRVAQLAERIMDGAAAVLEGWFARTRQDRMGVSSKAAIC